MTQAVQSDNAAECRIDRIRDDVEALSDILEERGRSVDESLDAAGILAVSCFLQVDESIREECFDGWVRQIKASLRGGMQ